MLVRHFTRGLAAYKQRIFPHVASLGMTVAKPTATAFYLHRLDKVEVQEITVSQTKTRPPRDSVTSPLRYVALMGLVEECPTGIHGVGHRDLSLQYGYRRKWLILDNGGDVNTLPGRARRKNGSRCMGVGTHAGRI